MSAYIYIEGGASGPNNDGSSSKYLTIACQKAFHSLLAKMGFTERQPRLVPCGGRGKVYDRFCIEHATGKASYAAMLLDAEEPMANIEQAWKHLAEVRTVPAWSRPESAEDEQVLFMTTCMETWVATDRVTLRAHYGQKLNENPLPALPNIENRSREAVFLALVTATRDCLNGYAKGKRSSEVLEKLNPVVLRQHLPSFVRVERILKTKL
ncbi:MAG TPA: DUF4276 family protein [Terrimicrobiaceae bacterium]